MNECRFCEGEGVRSNRHNGAFGPCPSCKGRGFRGEPVNDSQRLVLANERIQELEIRVKHLEGELSMIAEVASQGQCPVLEQQS